MGRVQLWVEQNYPRVMAVVALGAAVWLQIGPRSPGDLKLAGSIGLTVGTVAVGFLGTLAGVLLSTTSRLLEYMKLARRYGELLEYVWSAVRLGFVFILASIAMSVGVQEWLPGRWSLVPFAVWGFIGGYALAAAHRAISLVVLLLREIGRHDEEMASRRREASRRIS